MIRTTLLTAAIATGLFVVNAEASDILSASSSDIAPRSDWMSVSALALKMEEQGYTIREIEIEHGVYEVKMIDKNGMRVKSYIHPVTGKPVRQHGWDD